MLQQAVITFLVFLAALIADRMINAGMQVWAANLYEYERNTPAEQISQEDFEDYCDSYWRNR